MRSVAAVVALVVCVHAGLWSFLQRQQAVANIDAPLASVSYSPYARSQHPDYGDRPTPAQIRADLKILSPYTNTIRTYSSTGGVELVPASPRNSDSRSRWAPGSTRMRTATSGKSSPRSSSPAPQQRQRLSSSATRPSAAASKKIDDLIELDSARQALEPGSGDHGRNLARLERPSRACLGGRFHRRAHPCPTGKAFPADAGGRSDHRHLRQAAREHIPASASSSPNSAGRAPATICMQRQSRAASSRRPCCAISSRAPRPMASTTTSSKRSTSRGRSSKAASARIGAFSMPRATPNSAGPGRSSIPTTGSSRPSPSWSACCCRCRSWR